MKPRVEHFTVDGYQSITVRQLSSGRIIVTGATIAPASTNGLQLIPKPLPQP
jgi:hypothetical protein